MHLTTNLRTMTEQFPATVLWNDSADPHELEQSISYGAVGATCNPVIAVTCVKADLDRWASRIRELDTELPTATESEIGWTVVEELSLEAAALLEPAYDRFQGVNGRLSMQTDPRLARDAQALVRQAVRFDGLARNIIVKIPATARGIQAIEEATYRGVSINVTVSFTVAQAVAAAEAIERGLDRRQQEGLPIEAMGPVVTIMCGRLDDWLKECAARDSVDLDPEHLEWAGIAAFKKAYRIFTQRGYRSRLLSAAYRNTRQLSELVGGNVVVSPPFAWQQQIVDSAADLPERMSVPVDQRIIDSLYSKLPDFRRAFDEDGMTTTQFDSFGATRRTLRQFLEADEELDRVVRDVLIPAP